MDGLLETRAAVGKFDTVLKQFWKCPDGPGSLVTCAAVSGLHVSAGRFAVRSTGSWYLTMVRILAKCS